MKQKLFRYSILLLFIVCLNNTVLGQTQIGDLNECLEKQMIRSYYNPQEYIIACVECTVDYVVSYDLSSCIHYSDLSDNSFQFCKRLGKNESCVEALCAIQLNEKGEFYTITDGNSNENCARYDSSNKNCIYPRFNYVLDSQAQTITYDPIMLCALSKQGKCIEYHSLIMNFDQQTSVLINDFMRSEQIDKANSSITEIKCLKNYELEKIAIENQDKNVKIVKQYYGCNLIHYQVEHCINHNQQDLCIQCGEGYSLNEDKTECVQFENCIHHKKTGDELICILATANSYIENGKAYKLQNCAVQGQDTYCAYCNAPYYGFRCENQNSNISEDCELINREGTCAKCKYNDDNYYDIFSNTCSQRKLSLNCLNKSQISDSCNDFSCIDDYRFNIIHYQLYFGDNFFSLPTYSCDQIEEQVKSNHSVPWQNESYNQYILQTSTIRDVYYTKYRFNLGIYQEVPFCVERAETIDACIEYDKCYESCLICMDGYTLTQRNDDYNNYFYRFICVKNRSPIGVKINNCHLYSTTSFQCDQCEEYYTSIQSSCYKGSVKNCRIYGQNNTCKQCESQFILYKNSCFYVELCQSFKWIKDNLFCTKCIEIPDASVALVQTSNALRSSCVTNLPNVFCSKFIDDICVDCMRGFTLLSSSKKCVLESQVIPHCSRASESYKCTACVNGYQLVGDKCFKIEGSCSQRYKCSSDKCDVQCYGVNIDNKWTCKYSCPEGQGIYGDHCILCSDLYGEGCDKCNLQSICEHCKDGYFFDIYSNKCLFKCPTGQMSEKQADCGKCQVDNCEECPNPSKCKSCLNKFFLSDGKCIDKCPDNYLQYISDIKGLGNICFKCPDGCKKCSLDDELNVYCSICEDDGGWTLQNGICTKVCDKYLDSKNNCVGLCQGYINSSDNTNKCVDACPDTLKYFRVENTIQEGQLLVQVRICQDKCDDFTYKEGSECSKTCKEGYFGNTQTKICEPCSLANCKSCTKSVDTCDQCEDKYLLNNSACQYICENTNSLVLDSNQCYKCHIFGCSSDCFYDGFCTKCYENFILENSVCRCPSEKGYFIQYPAICMKCQIDNCQTCLNKNSCQQCNSGFKLNRVSIQDPKEGYQENDICVQDCPIGFYDQNGRCSRCIDNCDNCSSIGNCYKCKQGYVAITSVNTSLIDGLSNLQVQCLYVCSDNKLKLSDKQCSCSDNNCSSCPVNISICKTCESNFTLTSEKTCKFTPFPNCPVANCKQCDETSSSCLECIPGYLNYSGKCRYLCDNGELSSEDGVCQKSSFCEVDNCLDCNDENSQACKKCAPSYILDIYGKCVQDCEATPLVNQQICFSCPMECLKCDDQGKCLSCKGNNKLENNCLCPNGQKIYKNTCVDSCPFYSTLISNIYCIEYCASGLYPYYTQNVEQRLCDYVINDDAQFCLQNIQNLSKLISFDFDKSINDTTQISLIITVQQTPSICYKFDIRSSINIIQVVGYSEDSENSKYKAIIKKDQLECYDQNCPILFEVLYKNQVQLLMSVTLILNKKTIILDGINTKNQKFQFNAVCPTCKVPDNLILPSLSQIDCPLKNLCTDDTIKTVGVSQISITQTVNDPRFFNTQLQAHSLKLVYTNDSVSEVIIYINDYIYDNSILGQITYTFTTYGLRKGQILLTSVCYGLNQSLSSRMLAFTQESAFYPQTKINFEYQDPEMVSASQSNNDNNDDEESYDEQKKATTILAVILSIVGAILIVAAITIIYRYYKKKQHNLIYNRRSAVAQGETIQLEQHIPQATQETNKNEINIIHEPEIESEF